MDNKSLDRLTKINTLAAMDDDYSKMERDWKEFEKEFEAYVTKHHPDAKVEYEISGNIFDLIFQTDKSDLEIHLSRPEGGVLM